MRPLNGGEVGEAPQIKNGQDVMIWLKGMCVSSMNKHIESGISAFFAGESASSR